MLDHEGFRPNVGIILLNQKNQVFWGKRIRTHSWQFPQGGIDRGESPEQAMFRELHEEVGLSPEHVRIVARTRNWLRYEVPDRYIRRDSRGFYKGQKQIWFLLQLMACDHTLNLRATERPEFDAWRWNDYWVPLDVVVDFKRGVYEMALTELSRYLPRNPIRRTPFGLSRDKTIPKATQHLSDANCHDFADNRHHQQARSKPDFKSPYGLLAIQRLNGLGLELPPDASFEPRPPLET